MTFHRDTRWSQFRRDLEASQRLQGTVGRYAPMPINNTPTSTICGLPPQGAITMLHRKDPPAHVLDAQLGITEEMRKNERNPAIAPTQLSVHRVTPNQVPPSLATLAAAGHLVRVDDGKLPPNLQALKDAGRLAPVSTLSTKAEQDREFSRATGITFADGPADDAARQAAKRQMESEFRYVRNAATSSLDAVDHDFIQKNPMKRTPAQLAVPPEILVRLIRQSTGDVIPGKALELAIDRCYRDHTGEHANISEILRPYLIGIGVSSDNCDTIADAILQWQQEVAESLPGLESQLSAQLSAHQEQQTNHLTLTAIAQAGDK